MKYYIFSCTYCFLFLFTFFCFMAACDNTAKDNTSKNDVQTDYIDHAEEENKSDMEIIVGNQSFSVTLYDNETAEAFRELLPMTLDMSELNGNEKYYYLSDSLPTNSSRPSDIYAGDLMLYGSSCVVLFYESFSTSYSYTPLGRVDNTDGLAKALGSGDAKVTFQMK